MAMQHTSQYSVYVLPTLLSIESVHESMALIAYVSCKGSDESCKHA